MVRRALQVGLVQQGLDAQQQLLDGDAGPPAVSQEGQADIAVGVNVRVRDRRGEGAARGGGRVAGGEPQDKPVYTALPVGLQARRVSGSLHGGYAVSSRDPALPGKHVRGAVGQGERPCIEPLVASARSVDGQQYKGMVPAPQPALLSEPCNGDARRFHGPGRRWPWKRQMSRAPLLLHPP